MSRTGYYVEKHLDELQGQVDALRKTYADMASNRSVDIVADCVDTLGEKLTKLEEQLKDKIAEVHGRLESIERLSRRLEGENIMLKDRSSSRSLTEDAILRRLKDVEDLANGFNVGQYPKQLSLRVDSLYQAHGRMNTKHSDLEARLKDIEDLLEAASILEMGRAGRNTRNIETPRTGFYVHQDDGQERFYGSTFSPHIFSNGALQIKDHSNGVVLKYFKPGEWTKIVPA